MPLTRAAIELREMTECGAFVDPLLANTCARRLDPSLQTLVKRLVDRLSASSVRLEDVGDSLIDIPFSPRMMRLGLYDTLLSTAVVKAYSLSGEVVPTKAHLVSAAMAVRDCLAKIGVEGLYRCYYCVVSHDVLQPLVLNHSMLESEFLNNTHHHPYPAEQLEAFLFMGLARRSLRIKRYDGRRYIQLTRLGTERFQQMTSILRRSGYQSRREALSYIYQFENVLDWDEMCDQIWPDQHDCGRAFIDMLQIPVGAEVLEVACNTGELTFDAGLYEVVGESGHLTAVDGSEVDMEQARKKAAVYGFPPQVTLQQASVSKLPFADHTFDICLGRGVLANEEHVDYLREMTRVVRPGGTVAVMQVLEPDLERPFFRDWFGPVIDLSRKQGRSLLNEALPAEKDVLQWFRAAGLTSVEHQRFEMTWVFDQPDMVVQHMMRAVDFLQAELFSLPYDYRRTVIDELIDRGRDVCRRYPLSERVLQVPCLAVRGRSQA